LFAIPITAPEAPGLLIVLRHTEAAADTSNHALSTSALETLGESCSQFHKNGGVCPDILETVRGSMPVNKLWNGFSDTTHGVGTVGQYAEDAENRAAGAAAPVFPKHLPKRTEDERMPIVEP
jgi:hypothetical protein